jgi:hypothetical protein
MIEISVFGVLAAMTCYMIGVWVGWMAKTFSLHELPDEPQRKP